MKIMALGAGAVGGYFAGRLASRAPTSASWCVNSASGGWASTA